MRIVVRAEDVRTAREAQAQLAEAGVAAQAMAGAFRPAPDGEDITLVADAGSAAAAERARALLGSAQPPLAAIAGLKAKQPFPLGVGECEPFIGAVALDGSARLLKTQMKSLSRIALMEDERVRRERTAGALALKLAGASAPPAPRLLYIGPPSTAFLSLEHLFKAQGGGVLAAFSSFTGFDHVHDDMFDAIVLNAAKDPATSLSFCAALRRNASLYHLPTMMVTAAGDAETGRKAIDRGAAVVLAAGEPSGPGFGWLFEAIRRERRRRRTERAVRALQELMGDARTGLFQHAAFDAHLAQLAADHHASGRTLSLALLNVLPAHGASLPSAAVWTKGFNEIGSLAARLMRETDSGAAFEERFIAVAMPATTLQGARYAAKRIAAVAECTAFASGEGGAGPLVFEQAAVELQPGESGAALMARALSAFDAASAIA